MRGIDKIRIWICFGMSLWLCTGVLGGEPDSADKGKPDFKNWDSAVQYGPADTVSFTVSEGSWMNLDVSPDGKEIVFDLLGDIYIMPISGGKARLLSGGLPFEVQPRFSPDGNLISFTSDRGGADNIWVMNRDGSAPLQVTQEDFRLLNNAVWTPDGQYLIARKHFTSTRSLGAGEMWMYHLSGGSGLQLTQRKNDQQDAGEPCLSPDGRYLYYSEDMSGGSTFQYNKDPNGQIYVIRRLDRETGDLRSYISGPGGAARPQLSPDGKYLSFVRRIRDKSVLFVHDLHSGEQWPVFDRLNRDQQEAWAIFGVYSNYNWLPDSKGVVIWAQGKIWQVNIETREAREIPFEADVQQSIARAPRFQHPVRQEEFEAKMIRYPVTTPDGKWLVFNAVGQLWKKQLPNGKPQRLTTDEGWFELMPDISPDGKWVVYTTWQDTTLGAIRKVPLRGGKSLQLSHQKGYYYSPRFSPDGTLIVYRRGSGNAQLGFAHGLNPGIYWMTEAGGEGNLIIDDYAEPYFNRAGDRIYLFYDSYPEKTLKSVTLEGNDPRTHFTSKYATEIAVSPDEQWVAFQELFNVYITPYPKTGGSLDLSSGNKAIPLQRVTRDAGNYLRWSSDSQKLHWVIGPEFFTRELARTFDFVDNATDSIPPPDTTGILVDLFVPSDIPSGKLALTGARLITMKGDAVIEDGVIVTDRDRILAIGPRSAVRIPADAKQIDLSGKTIMPGIVDVHAHVWHFSNPIPPQQNWPYYANLAYGVTTTHDPSTTTEVSFSQAELVKAGKMVGPRIYSTGTVLYGAEGDFKAVVNNLDDARSHLRRMKAVGAFSVKSYNQPRRNQRQQVMQAARELQMHVYPEGGSFFFHNLSMILDGHTGIEHNIPVTPVYDDVIRLWGASQTGYTMTLVVSYGGPSGEYYWYQHSDVFNKQRLLNFTPRPIIDARSRRRTMMPDEEYVHPGHARDAKQLTEAGVKVNIGSHGQLQGLAAHWEIWMLAQGGFTPLEAIRCATYNGAHYLGMEQELGSLESGKLADLIVMANNPLENIRNTESIVYVMKNGRLYDAETMNEAGNHPRQRLPFYWELPRSSDAFVWKPGIGFGEGGCSCGRH